MKRFKGKIIKFGLQDSADYKASNVEFANTGMKFVLEVADKTYNVFVPGYGEHQVYNALAAIAASHEMGLTIRQAIAGLRTFKQMARHLEFTTGLGDSTIIDDTWTNNPTSVEAALKVLDTVGKDKRSFLF